MLEVIYYQPEYRDVWDTFVAQVPGGTFLFDRNFMEYHSDRFCDASLMIYRKGELFCCIPASIDGNKWTSHAGLTFGGLVFAQDVSSEMMQEIIISIQHILFNNNCRQINFKLPIAPYHPQISTIIQGLENSHFVPTGTFTNVTVSVDRPVAANSKKTAGYRNGKFDGLQIKRKTNFEAFWNQLLIPQLASKHQTKPVHNLAEIQLLAQRFPNNIIQHNVYYENLLVAGVTYFLFKGIAKSQYAACNDLGRKNRAMDFVYLESMRFFKDFGYAYLDLGTVNKDDGRIDEGLYKFKTELGGKAFNQMTYALELPQ
ncbi:MAG: hypothetical protein WBA16_03680 [Nonlabens sp.]